MKNEYSGTSNIMRLPFKRKVKRPWLLRSLVGLLPFLLITDHVIAQDSDRDGLSDDVEQTLGYDPTFFDSNVDGINDFQDAISRHLIDQNGNIKTDRPMSDSGSESSNTVGFKDNDGDQVDDFLEAYGYYYDQDAHDFFGVRRQLSQTEWQDFKSLPHAVSPNPFELAGSAIENDNWIYWNGQHYELDFVKARASLKNAFIAAYGADDALTKEGSGRVGSVSNIMKLLSEYPIIPPLTYSGEAIVYYFTDPGRKSSDYDPYSDGEEVSKVNANPLVTSPADHPLIAGFPVIKAHLESYSVVLKENIRDSTGATATSEWSTDVTVGTSTTNSTTETAGGGLEVGKKALSFSFSGESSTTKSTTTSSSVSTGSSQSDASTWNIMHITDSDCAANIRFNFKFINKGTAPAYTVVPRVNFYIGDALTATYLAQNDIGDLAVEENYSTNFPSVTETGLCVTATELKAIETGAEIRTDVTIDSAQVDFMDEDGVIHYKGDWSAYIDRINVASSKIQIRVEESNGTRVDKTYLTYAGNGPKLDVETALGITMGTKDCPQGGDESDLCLGKQSKTYRLNKDNTYVVIKGYDDEGLPLEPGGIIGALENEIGKPLTSFREVPLLKKWFYSLVVPESEEAKFLYSNLFYDNQTGNYVFEVAVEDGFSIDKVMFCPEGSLQEDDCHLMDANQLSTNLGVYQYRTLAESYTLTGNETIMAINTRGETSTMPPEFMIDDFVENVLSDLAAIKNQLLPKRSEAQRYVNGSLISRGDYLNAVAKGLIPDIEANLATINDYLAAIDTLLAECNAYSGVKALAVQCITDGLAEISTIESQPVSVAKIETVPNLIKILTHPIDQYYLVL